MVGRVRADDRDDRGMGAPGVVQVGQPVPQPRAQMQQDCRGPAHHRVAVGRAGSHPFKQSQHPRICGTASSSCTKYISEVPGFMEHSPHPSPPRSELMPAPRSRHTPVCVRSVDFHCDSAGALPNCLAPHPLASWWRQFTLANDPEEAGDDLNSQLLPGRAAIAEAGRRAAGVVRNRRSPAVEPAVDGAADTVGEFTPRGRAHPHCT